MNDIQQLIEQAKAMMTCPTCGRHYRTEEITFKSYLDQTYVLQATCSNNHPAVNSTWITSCAPATQSLELSPLDTDHVLALHQALQHFDGNFKALWPKER